MPTVGRKLQDIAQHARGRQALKYELEVIPYFCGEVPPGIERVLFAWERGSKLFVTDAEKVNPSTRACFFRQYLRQTATIYKEGNRVLPKEYTFKVQAVSKGAKGSDATKTFGKVKVDLAEFCTGELDPQPQDVFLQCKPDGKLKLSIKAKWQHDALVDPDAMTEATELTELSMTTAKSRKSKHKHDKHHGDDEQDLSGFDHAGKGAAHDAQQDEEGGFVDGQADGKQGHRRKGRKGRTQQRELPDEIPEGYELPADPDEVRRIREEKGYTDDAAAEAEYHRTLAAQQPESAGMRVHRPSWRDYLCCCCGPQHSVVLDPQESASLLTAKQAANMVEHNQIPEAEPAKPRKHRRKKRREQQQQQQGGDEYPGGEQGDAAEAEGGGAEAEPAAALQEEEVPRRTRKGKG